MPSLQDGEPHVDRLALLEVLGGADHDEQLRAVEVGAALVVDAIQSLGALPFDVAEVRPTFKDPEGFARIDGESAMVLENLISQFLFSKAAEGKEDNWNQKVANHLHFFTPPSANIP